MYYLPKSNLDTYMNGRIMTKPNEKVNTNNYTISKKADRKLKSRKFTSGEVQLMLEYGEATFSRENITLLVYDDVAGLLKNNEIINITRILKTSRTSKKVVFIGENFTMFEEYTIFKK